MDVRFTSFCWAFQVWKSQGPMRCFRCFQVLKGRMLLLKDWAVCVSLGHIFTESSRGKPLGRQRLPPLTFSGGTWWFLFFCTEGVVSRWWVGGGARGEEVYVVGSHKKLGAWEVQEALVFGGWGCYILLVVGIKKEKPYKWQQFFFPLPTFPFVNHGCTILRRLASCTAKKGLPFKNNIVCQLLTVRNLENGKMHCFLSPQSGVPWCSWMVDGFVGAAVAS